MTVLKDPTGIAYRFFSSEKENPGAWLVKEGQIAAIQKFPKELESDVSDCKISQIGAIDFGISGRKASLQSLEQNVFYPGQGPSFAARAQKLESVILDLANSHLKKQGISFSSVAYDKENPILVPGPLAGLKPVPEPLMA